ncbi:MAG: glycerol kinase [Pseudomonadota bacterium]|nr:glycerol kinase [Pseudomonadota bacterium]
MNGHVLVIDQGTTSTRCMVFGPDMAVVSRAQSEFPQHYPQPGWVEHDPEDLWRTTLSTAREALAAAGLAADAIIALGIANQRETTILWDRATGRPIANAIVWQDRRTGLRLDPYFSATKIGWLLDHVAGARARAEAGELAFGTVDSFLLWRLTEGRVHATDATNASRTLLCDLETGQWDPALLDLFGIPASLMPEIRDSTGVFGTTTALGGTIPIRGIAGDQQAALVGQACFWPGMVKATFGTGAFVLLHTGDRPVLSSHGMLTTIALQRGGRRSYAIEGSIFSAGTGVQWLRDGLGLIQHASEMDGLAARADPTQQVYLVPAFTGLGAPYWNSHARATLSGMSRGTTRHELARAVLEAVGYQTRDLLDAMLEDASTSKDIVLRVDGGMTASDWAMQFLADMLGVGVERPHCLETTALGAGYLAGLDAGLYPEPALFRERWALERHFTPQLAAPERARKWAGWQTAVAQSLHRT